MNKLFSIQKFPPEMTMTKRGNLLQPSQDMASEARPVSFDLLVKDVSIKRKKIIQGDHEGRYKTQEKSFNDKTTHAYFNGPSLMVPFCNCQSNDIYITPKLKKADV